MADRLSLAARHLLLALVVLLPAPAAISAASTRASPGSGTDIEVFVRDGCPHCSDAKEFLDGLQQDRPGLRIQYQRVDRDPAARARLEQIARETGSWPPGVPTFVIGETVLVGFDESGRIGQALVERLDAGAPAQPTDMTGAAGPGWLSVGKLGLPLFTVAIGLLDGFNPCAMWILLFLLALLVRLRDRWRMGLIAGTFVLVSGLMYYAFLAAWLNVFLVIGLSTPVRWALGLLALSIGAINIKDFLAWGRGPSLSIPDSAKPGLYARVRRILQAQSLPAALAAVSVLAVLVNFVELLCTAGLPAMYTAVLAQQDLSTTAYYGYLGLYILGYMTDDALMVGLAVAALASDRLSERVGRWLKLVSGMVMLGLALVLLLRPGWIL